MNRLYFASSIKRRTPRSLYRSGVLLVSGLFLLTVSLGVFGAIRPETTRAASNTTLTFQARLLNTNGSLVADGTYNVEFKIYDTVGSGASAQGVCSLDSSTDDCWWLETRTGANKVTVKNGYVYANLGSVTAFSSTIPWDQELWITMNIGGTGAPAWDGEMTPRFKVTAVPLAFVANNVKTSNAVSANSESITIKTGATTTSGNSGDITIDVGSAAGVAGSILLGTVNTSSLTLGRSGLTTSNAGALTVAQLLTGSLGATISGGATSINTSSNYSTDINTGTSTGLVTIGGGLGTFSLQTTNIDISSAGAITGATGMTSSGGYVQSGSTANTFTGVSTFSAVGTGLTVTNNATIGGALDVTGSSTLTGDVALGGTLNGLTINKTFVHTNDATAHNYLIASLPVSAGGTYDHIHILVNLNIDWNASSNHYIDAIFANRGGFKYQYFTRGSTPSTNAKLTAYTNGGVTNIYLSFNGGSVFTTADFTVLENLQATVYANPTDIGASPSGTLVFDSSSASYPPSTFTTTTGDTTFSGALTVTGSSTFNGNLTVGNAAGDTVTVNSGAWTFAGDTTVALTGGVNGLNFDSNTLSIDASNNRVGIGTAAPLDALTVNGNLRVGSSIAVETNALFSVGTSSGNSVSIGTSDTTSGAWIRNDGANTVISTNTGSIYYGLAGSVKNNFFYNQNSLVLWTDTSNFVKTASNFYVGYNLHISTAPGGVGSSSACRSVATSGYYLIGTCTSLARYKDEVEDIPLGIETIRQLRPVKFRWNIDSHDYDIGFIAEEITAVNPIFGEYRGGIGSELTGVKYHHLIALAVKGIQTNDARLTVIESGEFAGNLHVSGDTEVQKLTVKGKIISSGAAPVASIGQALTSVLGASITNDGTDTAGTITINSGSQSSAPGEIANVQFTGAYINAPKIVISGNNAKSSKLGAYVTRTANGFKIVTDESVELNQIYSFDYIIIEATN